MAQSKKYIPFFQAFLCTLSFVVFAYFIHNRFPIQLLAFAGLTASAFIISRQFNSFSEFLSVFGIVQVAKRPLGLILVGLMLGVIYSASYRNTLGISILPETIKSFAAVAALIGLTEELIFRGFIQGHVRKSINTCFSVVFGTVSHTAYKCVLFMSPVIGHKVDVLFLLVWTFAGGLIFGILKEYSKSVIPPVIAHAVFDVLAYAECATSPWWVW